MISEELLLLVEGIDPETTFEELVCIVDAHIEARGERPTRVQWENLADVAFLAFYHNKPKSFKRAVEMISYIFGTNFDAVGDSLGRACALICSDAPQDPRIILYMLGHLKGTLRAYRKFCEEGPDSEVKRRPKGVLARFLPSSVLV